MPIRLKCPHCKKGLAINEKMAGKKVLCPSCKKAFSVPVAVSAPADLEAFAAAALADQPTTLPTPPMPPTPAAPPPQTEGKPDGKVDGRAAPPPSAPTPPIE